MRQPDASGFERYPFLTLFFCTFLVFLFTHISFGTVLASTQDPNQIRKNADSQLEPDPPEDSFKLNIFWKDGLHINGRLNRWRFTVAGSVMLDAGQINSDDETQQAFPDFEGTAADFRQLRMRSLFVPADFLELRLDMDFANAREIKDNWIRFRKIPVVKNIQFGNQKEPFSLEAMTSSQVYLFMEAALPTLAFEPGRNIGARYHDYFFNERLSVWGGAFWNTGSYGNVGDTKDQLSESLGFSSSMRISTSKTLRAEKGHIVHAGLSYRYQVQRPNKPIRFSARPESYLTDVRLVDTGEFPIDDGHAINPELAFVYGPLSIQAEYFHTHLHAEADLSFSGFYLSSSWFLTGERRNYKRKEGVFNPPILNRKFNPKEGQWGAFELGLRYSFVDLNSQNIHGGEETNMTAGLNWYLFPRVRLMFNYINARVKNRLSPRIETGHSDIFMLRLQKGF